MNEFVIDNKKGKLEGFKMSKLGIIPDDWQTIKIGDLSEVTAGGTPSTQVESYWGGEIPWMSSGELNLKKVYDVAGRITEEGLKNSSTKIIPKMSVLIGLAGQGKTRGTVAMNYIALCTNQSIAAIYPSDSIYQSYLYYNLESRYNELRRLSTGDGGRGGLNLKIIRNIHIPIPTLEEQKKITTILSTWDTAIEKTEQLIEQLELRKKGLMQQLLSGKKRLAGFDEEWEEYKIEELTEYFSNRNKELIDAKVYSVTNTDGFIYQSDMFEREVASEDLSNYKLIREGEFAYNPARVNVGSIALFRDDIGIISSLYVCFRTNELLKNEYLLYLLETDELKHKIMRYGEGGVRIYLWYHLFKDIKITIPRIEEQDVIVHRLKIIDTELKLTRSKADKLKQQKKGLMQQLLTGKIRVKV